MAYTDSSGYFPESLRPDFDFFEFVNQFGGFDSEPTGEIVVTGRRPAPFQGFVDLPPGYQQLVTDYGAILRVPPGIDITRASRDEISVKPKSQRRQPLSRRASHLLGSGLDLGDPAVFRHAMLTPGAAILRDKQLLRYIDNSARGARRAISIVGAGALGSRALKESLRAMPPAARPHLLRFLELIMPAAENDPNRFPSPREVDPLEWVLPD